MSHSSVLRLQNPLSKIRASEPNSVIQLVCCLVNDTRWSLNFKIRNPRCISGRVSTLEIFFCSARVVLVWLSVPRVLFYYIGLPPNFTHKWVRLLFTFFWAAFAFMWWQFIQIETLDKLNLHVSPLIVTACIYA